MKRYPDFYPPYSRIFWIKRGIVADCCRKDGRSMAIIVFVCQPQDKEKRFGSVKWPPMKSGRSHPELTVDAMFADVATKPYGIDGKGSDPACSPCSFVDALYSTDTAFVAAYSAAFPWRWAAFEYGGDGTVPCSTFFPYPARFRLSFLP